LNTREYEKIYIVYELMGLYNWSGRDSFIAIMEGLMYWPD